MVLYLELGFGRGQRLEKMTLRTLVRVMYSVLQLMTNKWSDPCRCPLTVGADTASWRVCHEESLSFGLEFLSFPLLIHLLAV